MCIASDGDPSAKWQCGVLVDRELEDIWPGVVPSNIEAVFLLDDTIEVDFRGNDPLSALEWTGQNATPGRNNETPTPVENVTRDREPTQVGVVRELLEGKVLAR